MKKLFTILTFVAVVFFFLGATAGAQNITQGFKQLSIDGSLDPATADGVAVEISSAYGQFIRDYLLVGGSVALLNDDVSSAFMISAVVQKLFPTGSPFVPFVEGGIGLFSMGVENENGGEDWDESGILISGSAGVKYFINEGTSINANAMLIYATEDIFVNDVEGDQLTFDDFSNTEFTFNLGMSFYF